MLANKDASDYGATSDHEDDPNYYLGVPKSELLNTPEEGLSEAEALSSAAGSAAGRDDHSAPTGPAARGAAASSAGGGAEEVFAAELHSGVGPVGALGAGGAVAGGDAVAALGGGALGGFDGGGGGAGASSARGALGTGSRPLTPRARVVISAAHAAAVRTSGSVREPPPSAAAAEAHACFAR